MKQDKITSEIIIKYRRITQKALAIARDSVAKEKQKDAKEILTMAEAYMSDSIHFEEKGDLINSFGAIYYAHGWLDCGARLKVFNVSDTTLFTV